MNISMQERVNRAILSMPPGRTFITYDIMALLGRKFGGSATSLGQYIHKSKCVRVVGTTEILRVTGARANMTMYERVER